MNSLTEARDQIAAAVTATGIACSPYPPDAFTAPGGWVDSLTIDLESGPAFCMQGMVTGTVVVAAQRHDRAGGVEGLEDLIQPILTALGDVGGIRALTAESASIEVAGTTLPSVIFTIQFGITS